jgi:hypothetical protein
MAECLASHRLLLEIAIVRELVPEYLKKYLGEQLFHNWRYPNETKPENQKATAL